MRLAVIVLSMLLSDLPTGSNAPEGWFLAGSRPSDYTVGTDTTTAATGTRSSYLAGNGTASPDGFGTLMQSFRADAYRGKRLRLVASVRAEDVEKWAGVWMRVDGERKVLSFDNMQDRPIRGTAPWTAHEIVLDVPQNATGISFGILLAGNGKVWIDDVKFEDAGTILAPAERSLELPRRPVNLDFEQ